MKKLSDKLKLGIEYLNYLAIVISAVFVFGFNNNLWMLFIIPINIAFLSGYYIAHISRNANWLKVLKN